MSDAPQLLLQHHLKALMLPTFLREYDKVARQCATEGVDHPGYLLRLAEQELIDRERRMVERRIRQARFPTIKSLESFDFTAVASLNKPLVLELARCEWIRDRSNVCLVGQPGTGKTHLSVSLGLAATRHGHRVRFYTAAALVTQLEAKQQQYQLDRFLAQLDRTDLLICDELGYLSFSRTGAELLFQVFADRYERRSLLITSNLAFSDWGQVFQGERMTAALLDRLTHRCHIFEMNGESYRFRESMKGKTGSAKSKRDSTKNKNGSKTK